MEPRPSTRKRSKHACKNCRRKKARCPAERPVCSFCKRLNQVCEYDSPPPQEQSAKATAQLRATKLADRVAQLESQLTMLAEANNVPSSSMSSSPGQRASIDPPVSMYTGDDLSRSNISRGSVQQSPQASPFENDMHKFQTAPPDHVSHAAIDVYFRVFHNHPCTFFNEDRFRLAFSDGSVPDFLTMAIVASVAPLLIDPWFEDLHFAAARTMAQAAWQQILADILPTDDASCVEAVQATGLLALLDFKMGVHQAGLLKLRICITIAQNLHLNLDPTPSDSPMEQEERRHVFWTIYILDRVSAFTLDRPILISDDECVLRLPEDMDVFRCKMRNDMPDLKSARTNWMSIGGNYAKLIMSMSVVGSMVIFCHGSQLHSGTAISSGDALYSALVAQADGLRGLLQNGSPVPFVIGFGPDHAESRTTHNLGAQSEIPARYAQLTYHVIQMFINHPFLLRRHPSLVQASRNSDLLHRRLSLCHQHAVELLRTVDKAQKAGAYLETQFFPGWIMFCTAIVHCLFMHSPDRAVAQVSKDCFRKAQMLMYDQSMVDGSPEAQAYSTMLDFFGRNAGFASWLVDPSFPMFVHPSKSPSYWRFMDFDWLCEQFCVGANPLSASLSPLASTPQEPSMDSVIRMQSAGSTASTARSPLTPQSIHGGVQAPRIEDPRYLPDSRFAQTSSNFAMPGFAAGERVQIDSRNSLTGATVSQDESHPGLTTFNMFQ